MKPVTNPGLPRWLNEPADWYTEPRPAWLEAVHAARQAIFRRAVRGAPAGDATVVANSSNDLVGSMLLHHFVQHRSADVIPDFASLPPGPGRTAGDICGWLRDLVASPLLRSVFEPAAGCEQSRGFFVTATVNDAYARLPDSQFPVTAFGDYHQHCLSRPLHRPSGLTSADEPRTRDVHFTPAPLVDYLTDATLRELGGPEPDSRLLDPSCGCGVFLIAAARFLADQYPEFGGPVRVQRLLDVMGASIFGIDINPHAVECTRRSLLLAAWEGDPMGDHSQVRIQDLRRNLVAADFLATTRPAEFPTGFDAILGGPPFVRYNQLRK
jgi:Putative RNA methylase family UPF0020